MDGVRSLKMVETAAIAAQRVAGMLTFISDAYAPETPLSDIRELKFKDAENELRLRGHIFDPNCTSDFCRTAGSMIQEAIAQMGQQDGS